MKHARATRSDRLRSKKPLPHRNPVPLWDWLREYQVQGKWLSVKQVCAMGLAHRMTWWDQRMHLWMERLGEAILANPDSVGLIAGDM